MVFALVLIAAAAAWVALERNNELFVLDWRDGEMRLVRGTVPVRLRAELAELLRAARVHHTQLRVTSRVHSARLVAVPGVDAVTLQQLRAALQRVPMAQMRDVAAPAQNRVLRVFGISSWVWLLGTADE